MRRATTLALAIAGLWLAGAPAGSTAGTEPGDAFDRCMDKAAGVTYPMLDCINAEHDRQDRRLNANYKQLMGALDPERQEMLRAAQRAWLAYRAAECDWEGSADMGGSLQMVEAAQCRLTMTETRADELGEALKNERESPK